MPWKNKSDQLKYQRDWVAKRRAEWLAANGPCKRCGSSTQPQIDHIDPSKKVNHRVFGWSRFRREAELAKCQVLCKMCHLAKSRTEGSVPSVRHGTRSRYRVGKCRCASCVAWNTANCQKKRLKRRSAPTANLVKAPR